MRDSADMRTLPFTAVLLVPAAVVAQPGEPPNPDVSPPSAAPAAPVPAPSPAPADQVVPPAAGPAAGVAFGVSLELTPTTIGNNAPLLPSASTHVLIGYHTDRITIGATLDLERYSASSNTGMGMTTSDSLSTVLIGPVIRVAVARSGTGTNELLAVGDIAYRTFSLSSSQQMGTTPDLGHVVTAHIGISIQHWLSPHFALAATAAARIDDFAPPSSSSSSSAYAAALGYSLDMLGVF